MECIGQTRSSIDRLPLIEAWAEPVADCIQGRDVWARSGLSAEFAPVWVCRLCSIENPWCGIQLNYAPKRRGRCVLICDCRLQLQNDRAADKAQARQGRHTDATYAAQPERVLNHTLATRVSKFGLRLLHLVDLFN
jgi:hypothetical protein